VHEDFYSAVIQEPTTVMGLRLRPFSLGHVILLGRVKSSFVTEGETLSLHDLALSVLICAQTYADGLKLFSDRNLSKFFTRWHSKLRGESWVTRIGWRKPVEIDYAQKARELSDYIQKGSKVPDYSYQPADFKEMNCPSVQIVKVTLMRDMGFTEAELMDRPWALCLWDFVTLRALAGHVRMIDGEEIKEAQAAADRLDKLIKEGKWHS
jgi:hypothetical protein